MKTYTVKLYLLGFKFTGGRVGTLTAYWESDIPKNMLASKFWDACLYGAGNVDHGNCCEYHVISGEN